MASESLLQHSPRTALPLIFASLARLHIVLIAAGGSLVFGWLLTGAFHPALAAVVALDWFLVNIVNRVVDRDEDAINNIHATQQATRYGRAIYALAIGLYAASFAMHLVWLPWLLVPRLCYHGLGAIYNFRLIPTSRGPARLKEMFGFKNTASMAGFLLTLFAYPLAVFELQPGVTPLYVALLIAYFAPFELSFEAIYDLRDVKGDRAAQVRSYPVVMGELWTARMIQALNVASVLMVLLGLALNVFVWKDAILGVGPLLQLWLFQRGFARGFVPADCIRITWTFALMLLGYVGWVGFGLPLELGVEIGTVQVIEIGLVVIALICWRWYAPLYGRARYAAIYLLVVVSSWLAEQSAISIYRFYYYADSWDVIIGDVPLAVILIWPMVILTTHHVVRRLGFSGMRAVLLGAGFVIAEALLIEVVCVQAGLWFWEGRGVFGVPLIGVLGWAFFALGALFAVERLRGFYLLLMPLLGLISTHALLQIFWRAGFGELSNYSVLPSAALAAIAVVALVATIFALRVRMRARLSLVEIFPRLLAAQLMYYLLFLATGAWQIIAFALLFVPPYVVLCVYDWAMPGERGPRDLSPR